MKSPLADMTLRSKLWLGLGGMFFILLVGSAISAIVLTHFSHELQRLLRENYDSEVYCDQMTDALDRLDAAGRRLAWNETGPAVDAAEQQARFDENLAKQFQNVSLPGEFQATKLLSTQWKSYRSEYGRLASARISDRPAIYSQSVGPIYANTRATARQIATLNMNNVVSADGRVRQTLQQVRNVLLVLVAAGAALAILVLAAAGATVLKPLGDLTRSVGRIGAGDLDLVVPIRSNNEVGQLAAAFNTMAERLREYRKIDHERLLRAQSTTQLAIDSLPDAVLVASPAGAIEIANRTGREHFNAQPGRNIAELDMPWLSALHADAAAGNDVEPRGYASAVQLFHQGEEKFFLPRGVPMMHDNQVVGVAIILVDVTRLRQVDEFKSGLVSTVSHELRTPLTSLRMSTNLLADPAVGPLTPSQKKLVEAARDESERLYRIIENLLNFSRAQAGAARISQQSTPVTALINDALDPLRGGFEQKRIRVTVSGDGTPNVWADPALAASVIGNLLSNAMKFTPVGGRVEITARLGGDNVVISVDDSGAGVAPEHVGHLFQRFFRATVSDGPPGTGLGLAIAREIAIAHGGTISYAPHAGGGSSFRFSIPIAKAAAQ